MQMQQHGLQAGKATSQDKQETERVRTVQRVFIGAEVFRVRGVYLREQFVGAMQQEHHATPLQIVMPLPS